jgi:hypothetical protein
LIQEIDITDPYMTVTKLQITRMNHIMIPKKEQPEYIKSKVPKLVRFNLFEIEKMFTLIFMHPCYYYDIIEVIKIEEYDAFVNGIRPLYTELVMPFNTTFSKSEPLDNMLLISTFRILVIQDYMQFKNDLDSLFNRQKSFAELILEFYFYNV